jgi:hypothetical protein
MSKEDAREAYYGMPFSEWKNQHQTEASTQTQAEFKTAFASNVGTKNTP